MLEPGRNCWRIERATRATVLVDADNYFTHARDAMLKAKKQILLIGWDFDARIRFKTDPASEGPEKVGEFISWLVRRTPGLQVHILRWDTGAIKTLFHGRTLIRIAKWIRDPQVHMRLDGHHPVAGSHHQKVVVIDDDVAFCGGIDMTVDRWDTREHRDDDPRRIEPDGTPYKPWHDVTTALEGPVAAALGDMCRQRWAISGGGELPAPTDTGGCWPTGLDADFTDVEVAVARTIPEMANQEPVHEIETLYLDLIARAERFLYAESQYFASRKVAEAIARRLDEPDGPEIVIVNPTTAEGWLEPVAMDSARARLFKALKERDRHDRLRLYHPFTAGGTAIYVHAKVTVIDDQLLRVGSSNFNNRSLRLDTECDVTIDATRSANADECRTIAGIRNSLIAEHLGVECEDVESTLARTGSLIATIEELRGEGRALHPYEIPDLDAVTEWLADNKILDPEGPGEMFESLSERTPLLKKLKKHRPHLHRADNSLSPVVTAVAVGGTVAGGTLLGLMLWQAWKRRDDTPR
ncbi:phospholipase D-like domain-containing protein [Sphingomonas hankookensis]|uniref:phospholipase D-like domain-containing protein n=1 Tax=Sphingomonas hankookensis TaxID=563996 RepID=UPI003F798D07